MTRLLLLLATLAITSFALGQDDTGDPTRWKTAPFLGASFKHSEVVSSGTQQVILIGQTYYPAAPILEMRSIGDVGIVTGNPAIIHWYTCKALSGLTNVVPVNITEFGKARPDDYCKQCMEWRNMHGPAGTTVRELFKKKSIY